ncbi:hypothetical protein [Myxococcus fulvus]|uniref:hypothetical protein n=1 Tax=Myxococcus fulvus TaxID=33 RepID=UPI0020BD8A25|nr:hypothetical protein [Myxococcus fulvus]MCK8496630.1 hypothetical protein [Myxococcus fulvus]
MDQDERDLIERIKIVKKSIRRWDDGKKVTDAEREVIVQRIADYLKAGGAQHVKVIE